MSSTYHRKRNPNHRVYPVVAQLAAARGAEKISQRALSYKMGYDCVTVGRWERGETLPSLQAVYDWCEALGVEMRVSPCV